MTIPEAVSLVLQAGAFTENGEVFVLDMGEPVNIYSLAEELIRLSGYKPHEDIEIKVIGLRPGEKLFEELRFDNEEYDTTQHEGIFINKLQKIGGGWLAVALQKMRECAAAEDAAGMRRGIGAAALEATAAQDESERTRRRATVAARLPGRHWPERPVLITAVDARTGKPVVFDRHSGVDLADAVTASCSGAGTCHGIGGDWYIDGGYRRNENADLATGCERVLVLSPFGGRSRHPADWGMQLSAQVDELRAHGSRVETCFPDSDSQRLFGANALDLSLRPPAARAGYEQGKARAGQLTGFWL